MEKPIIKTSFKGNLVVYHDGFYEEKKINKNIDRLIKQKEELIKKINKQIEELEEHKNITTMMQAVCDKEYKLKKEENHAGHRIMRLNIVDDFYSNIRKYHMYADEEIYKIIINDSFIKNDFVNDFFYDKLNIKSKDFKYESDELLDKDYIYVYVRKKI